MIIMPESGRFTPCANDTVSAPRLETLATGAKLVLRSRERLLRGSTFGEIDHKADVLAGLPSTSTPPIITGMRYPLKSSSVKKILSH